MSSSIGAPNDAGAPGLSVDLGAMNEADTATISYLVTVDGGATGLISSQGSIISNETLLELTDSSGDDSDGDQANSITVGSALSAQISAPLIASEKILVTVSYTLSAMVEPESVITNTASLTWASATGATSFSAITDEANVTIGSATINKSISSISPGYAGNLTEVHIGEVIDYTIVIDIPEGSSSNVTFSDLLDNGLAFTDVLSITASSGDLTTSIGTFSDVQTAATITNSGVGTHQLDRYLSLDFGTLTNSNSNDGTAETITIVTSIRVLNWTGNTRGNTLNNSAAFNWDNPNGPGQLSVTDSASNVTIVEPELIITKTLSTATADAGDTITVTIDIAHTGFSDADAFDVSLDDVLPAGLTFVGGLASSGLAPTTGPSHAGGTVSAAWDSISHGSTAQISFDVTVDSIVTPESTIINTASLEWESLFTADEGALANSPNNTLGVERTGNTADVGITANSYSVSSSDSFTIPAGSLSKAIQLITPNGAPGFITAGDTVDYRIIVTLPEGMTSNLVLTDVLPAGLSFESAMVDAAGFNGSVVISSIVSDGMVTIGETVTISFNTPTFVAADNLSNNSFSVFISALVEDDIANDGLPAVQNKTNTATLSYAGSMTTIQDTASIDFAEADLSITKTMAPDTGLSAGDTVTITLKVDNTGSSPAYDVVLTDVLNSGGEQLFDTSSASSLTTPPGFTYGFADPTVTWTADSITSIAAGSSSTFTFTAIVRSDVVTGSTFDNTASVSGDSQDGLVTGERFTSDTDADTVSTAMVSSGKSLIASSESWTSDTAPIEVAIGEILTFQLALDIPQGLTREDGMNAIITDTLPTGHSYISASATIRTDADTSLTGSSFGLIPIINTTIVPVVNGQVLEFDLGDLQNNDNDAGTEQIIIEYDVLVENTSANNRTNSKTNTVAINYLNTDSNPQSITDTASWSVAEPNISITKTASPATVEGGDTVTFTVVLSNIAATNATRAWEPIITDTLPGRFQAPFTVISVIHSNQGLLGGSASFIGNVLAVDLSGDLATSDNYLDVGETITLVYSAVVDPAINYEEDITNTAMARVSSFTR